MFRSKSRAFRDGWVERSRNQIRSAFCATSMSGKKVRVKGFEKQAAADGDAGREQLHAIASSLRKN